MGRRQIHAQGVVQGSLAGGRGRPGRPWNPPGHWHVQMGEQSPTSPNSWSHGGQWQPGPGGGTVSAPGMAPFAPAASPSGRLREVQRGMVAGPPNVRVRPAPVAGGRVPPHGGATIDGHPASIGHLQHQGPNVHHSNPMGRPQSMYPRVGSRVPGFGGGQREQEGSPVFAGIVVGGDEHKGALRRGGQDGPLTGASAGSQAGAFGAAQRSFGPAPVGGEGGLKDPFLGMPVSPDSKEGIVMGEESNTPYEVWRPAENNGGQIAVGDAHGRLVGDEQGRKSVAGAAGGEGGHVAAQGLPHLALPKNVDGIVDGVETDGTECFFSPVGTTTFESACSGVVWGVKDAEGDAGMMSVAAGPKFGTDEDGIATGVAEGEAHVGVALSESAVAAAPCDGDGTGLGAGVSSGHPVRSHEVFGLGSGHGTVEGNEEDAGASWVPRDFVAPVRLDSDSSIMAGAKQCAWRPVEVGNPVHDEHDDDLDEEGAEGDMRGNGRPLGGDPARVSDKGKDGIVASTKDDALEHTGLSFEVAALASVDYFGSVVAGTEEIDDGIVAGVEEGAIDYVEGTAAGTEEVVDGIVAGVEVGTIDYVKEGTGGGHCIAAAAKQHEDGVFSGVEKDAMEWPALPVGAASADYEGNTVEGAERRASGCAGVPQRPAGLADDEGEVEGTEEDKVQHAGPSFEIGVLASVDYWGGRGIVEGAEEDRIGDGIVMGSERNDLEHSGPEELSRADCGVVSGVEKCILEQSRPAGGVAAIASVSSEEGIVEGVEQGNLALSGSSAVFAGPVSVDSEEGIEEGFGENGGANVMGSEEDEGSIVVGVEEDDSSVVEGIENGEVEIVLGIEEDMQGHAKYSVDAAVLASVGYEDGIVIGRGEDEEKFVGGSDQGALDYGRLPLDAAASGSAKCGDSAVAGPGNDGIVGGMQEDGQHVLTGTEHDASATVARVEERTQRDGTGAEVAAFATVEYNDGIVMGVEDGDAVGLEELEDGIVTGVEDTVDKHAGSSAEGAAQAKVDRGEDIVEGVEKDAPESGGWPARPLASEHLGQGQRTAAGPDVDAPDPARSPAGPDDPSRGVNYANRSKAGAEEGINANLGYEEGIVEGVKEDTVPTSGASFEVAALASVDCEVGIVEGVEEGALDYAGRWGTCIPLSLAHDEDSITLGVENNGDGRDMLAAGPGPRSGFIKPGTMGGAFMGTLDDTHQHVAAMAGAGRSGRGIHPGITAAGHQVPEIDGVVTGVEWSPVQ